MLMLDKPQVYYHPEEDILKIAFSITDLIFAEFYCYELIGDF